MLDDENRGMIMNRLGGEADDLVADLYSDTAGGVSVVQEAGITSRLRQRLEDRLDSSQVGDYIFRVIAQSLPDSGPNSMEELFGAYLFLSISLDGADGFDKGIFIQEAKLSNRYPTTFDDWFHRAHFGLLCRQSSLGNSLNWRPTQNGRLAPALSESKQSPRHQTEKRSRLATKRARLP